MNTINVLEIEEGGEAKDANEISEVATLFFQKLFKSNGVGDSSHLLTDIESRVSAEVNNALL